MTLTKLSREYHRLKAEGKLRDETGVVKEKDQQKTIPRGKKATNRNPLEVSGSNKENLRKKKLYSSPQRFLEISPDVEKNTSKSGSFSVSSVPPEVARMSSGESEPSDRRESVASTISREK